MSDEKVNVDEKLGWLTYKADHSFAHIKITDDSAKSPCANECKDKPCTFICPAACYKVEGNREVTLITDGCLECGSCRVICTEHANVAWEYPRGGHGILFKFG